jgi:hypothetical protein
MRAKLALVVCSLTARDVAEKMPFRLCLLFAPDRVLSVL